MDGIELPYENVLNYSAFSIRIAEKDVPRLPAILRAVPPERIAEGVGLHLHQRGPVDRLRWLLRSTHV